LKASPIPKGSPVPNAEPGADFSAENLGSYVHIPAIEIRIISIFDELRYDRSDADIVSPAMRMHIAKTLAKFGFRQKSGTVFENKQRDIKCLIPKSHALGASPFHITQYTPKRGQDFYILTPTQTACQIIHHCELEDAIEHIHQLIQKQPINLYRLSDYLDYSEQHQEAAKAIGHIKYLQRKALETGPLRNIRPLSLTKH
jgi:hypothetical protein